MPLTTMGDLVAGMSSGGYSLPISRASIATTVAAAETSLWRGTGFPTQGAIPAAAAICNAATVGALPLAPRSGAQVRIISQVSLQMAGIGNTMFIEDRLGHMGGLSGTVTTAQAVNLDIHANIATNNLAERVGAANYSELEWYLEWYTATGATITTPTCGVTFDDGTTGTVNVWVQGGTALPASVAASRRYKLISTNGKYIRSVQSVTLSASTATAGSFGVTAIRSLVDFEYSVANAMQVRDWSALNSPKVADNACVTFAQMCIGTSTGATIGAVRQAVN